MAISKLRYSESILKMKQQLFTLFLVGLLAATVSCSNDYPTRPESGTETAGDEISEAVPVSKTNQMNIYVHWMPWFETDTSNSLNAGKWGWHWTMNTCNPNTVPANGNRQIASHYYPLTGPYASGDETILDYQCLLMKYAGVDGVMADWYGANGDNAMALHKSNTEAMFRVLKRAGLKMAVVYEDQTLANASDKVVQARTDMKYLAKTFFKDEAYAKVDNRPLLLDFGPQGMTSSKEWYRSFAVLATKPFFMVLDGHSNLCNDNTYPDNAQGEYSWVNPLPNYASAKNFKFYIGGAMPGFHDFYKEGGSGGDYTTYDSEDGALFKRQLDAARKAGLSWLQISTWNDYGEGTTIEPTREYGYRYLVALQEFTGVTYRQADLELIYQWYLAKIKNPDSQQVKEAYDALVKLDTEKARQLLNVK